MKFKLLFGFLCFWMVQLDAQNVGIGRTNPAYILDILDQATTVRLQSITGHTSLQLRTVAGKGNYVTFHRDGAPSFWIHNPPNNDLQFRPLAGNAAMVVKENGRVGIGLSTPSSQLHVRDTNALLLELQSMTDHTFMTLHTIPGKGNYIRFLRNSANSFWVYNTPTDDLQFRPRAGDAAMTIRANGNVGVGTSSPGGMLTVRPDSASRGFEVLSVHGNTHVPWTNGWSYLSGEGLIFRTSGNLERMRIAANGNVGIGTNNPNTKLAVNGNVRSREVLVETANWPDYVFEESYELPTLTQEADFIKEKGHLSGFESEKAMDGIITVGDITKRQQEKIEQMMLHLIDMNEKMEDSSNEMGQKVEALESKIKQLEQTVETLNKENQQLRKQ